MALFCLRSFGATVLFWIWSMFTAPREQIELRDAWKVAVASFLGLFMTQLSFLFAITKTTAIDAVHHVHDESDHDAGHIGYRHQGKDYLERHPGDYSQPHRRSDPDFQLRVHPVGRGFHVHLGHSGNGGQQSLFRVIRGHLQAGNPEVFRGDLHEMDVPVLVADGAPLLFWRVQGIQSGGLSMAVVWQVLFVVVAATFIAYFLIPIGQKRLRPVVVCMYTYVQPVIAMIIALAMGLDTLNALRWRPPCWSSPASAS
jgi:EamA-like transporter family.